jgi:hypothetical protein
LRLAHKSEAMGGGSARAAEAAHAGGGAGLRIGGAVSAEPTKPLTASPRGAKGGGPTPPDSGNSAPPPPRPPPPPPVHGPSDARSAAAGRHPAAPDLPVEPAAAAPQLVDGLPAAFYELDRIILLAARAVQTAAAAAAPRTRQRAASQSLERTASGDGGATSALDSPAGRAGTRAQSPASQAKAPVLI